MMSKNKKKSALLLGSYGHTNIGDDLLMYNYVFLLRESGFEKIYTNVVASDNVPKEIASFVCMKETYKTSFLEWINILREVDVVCYGGGTILKELYKSTSRTPYAIIARIVLFNFVAKCLGKTVYNLNIGIGSLQTNFGKFITKIALMLCDFTIFRDSESYNFAKEDLKINIKKICLGKDGLFINKKWHNHRSNNYIKNKPVRVGINVLSDIPDWISREKYLEEMRAFINAILQEDFFVVFIPFQHLFNQNNDKVFIQREILPYLRLKNYELIDCVLLEDLISTFKSVDFFVGMRFHSLLLSISTATPFLAVEYDTKCSRLINEFSYKHSIAIEDLKCESLLNKFNSLLSDRDENIESLIKLGDRLYGEEVLCEKELWKKLKK